MNTVEPSFGTMLNFAVVLTGGLLYLPIAALADRLHDGLFTVMMAACAFLIILSLPLMYIIQLGSTCLFGVVIGHLFLDFGVVLYSAPMIAWMIQKFPVAVRYSALAIAYNVALMLFGGTGPIIATAMTCNSPSFKIVAGVLFMIAALISGLTVYVADKTTFGKSAFSYLYMDTLDLQQQHQKQRQQESSGGIYDYEHEEQEQQQVSTIVHSLA